MKSELLIPRKVIFDELETASPRMSHDGRQLAWAEQRHDVTNIFACRTDDVRSPRQLTFETRPSLTSFLLWARNNRHLITFRDECGDETYTACSLDTESGRLCNLSVDKNARTLFLADSAKHPDKVILCMNCRDRSHFDLYEANLADGHCRLVFENTGFSKLHVDNDLNLRVVERVNADGSIDVFHARSGFDWQFLFAIPTEDALTTRVEAVGDRGEWLYLIDSRGRDKAALYQFDVATLTRKLLAEDDSADVHGVMYHPITWRALACVSTRGRQVVHWLDEGFRRRFEQTFEGFKEEADIELIDFDDAMHLALLRAVRSDEPPGYFLDEPAEPSRRMEPVFTPLAAYSFGKMEVATITSRDGWPMVAYLTRAARLRADGRLVLVVHGGPYDRDRWGYVPVHQWLADRGYSVLSVNFRGSTGFGKAFTGAARHEWGGRMQDDLSDAVGWAVARGIADPDRVAIYGVSYGGYAALMGVARDPHIFACAVDVCGPSSLLSFVEGIPESWKSWFPTILQHLATPQTSEGRDWLLQRSPLHLVSAIQHPVLIVQGLRDARVAATESTEMFKALSDNGAEVTYLAFSDEGHFFTKTTNRLLLASVVERFLARHLGGLFEPTDGGFESQSVSALGSMVLRGDIRQSQDIHQNNGSGMKGKV